MKASPVIKQQLAQTRKKRFFCKYFMESLMKKRWCRKSDSNQRPTDYKSVALPAELYRHQQRELHQNSTPLSRGKNKK